MIVPEKPSKQQAGEERGQGHRVTVRAHRAIEFPIHRPAPTLRAATGNAIKIVVAPASDVSIVLSMIQEKAVIPFPIGHSIV